MEYQFSSSLRGDYLHVKVLGMNNPANVRRWALEAIGACRKHRCGKLLVEEYLLGESIADMDTFMIATEGAKAALGHLTHVAYVDTNPEHSKDTLKFAEHVVSLNGINMRLFGNIRDADQWLTGIPAGPSVP
jgi:hypothetical protein